MKTIKNKLVIFLFNFRKKIALFLYNLSGRDAENQKKLLSYKDKFKDKRCFIVCTGQSLTMADLEILHENREITFSCNRINKLFTKTNWRPTFYCISDETLQYTLNDAMNEVPAEAKFFRKESYLNTRKIDGNKIWLNVNGDRSLLDDPVFSKDCDIEVKGIATVTYVMLELAAYMGFSEIYIIGCDNSYGVEVTKDGKIVKKNVSSYYNGLEGTVKTPVNRYNVGKQHCLRMCS